MDWVLVRTTLSREAEARTLARRLVDARLACCVHVAPIHSTYQWDAETFTESEWSLETRTLRSLAPAAQALIRSHHPYETPLLEVLAIESLDEPYAEWARARLGTPNAAPRQNA